MRAPPPGRFVGFMLNPYFPFMLCWQFPGCVRINQCHHWERTQCVVRSPALQHTSNRGRRPMRGARPLIRTPPPLANGGTWPLPRLVF